MRFFFFGALALALFPEDSLACERPFLTDARESYSCWDEERPDASGDSFVYVSISTLDTMGEVDRSNGMDPQDDTELFAVENFRSLLNDKGELLGAIRLQSEDKPDFDLQDCSVYSVGADGYEGILGEFINPNLLDTQMDGTSCESIKHFISTRVVKYASREQARINFKFGAERFEDYYSGFSDVIVSAQIANSQMFELPESLLATVGVEAVAIDESVFLERMQRENAGDFQVLQDPQSGSFAGILYDDGSNEALMRLAGQQGIDGSFAVIFTNDMVGGWGAAQDSLVNYAMGAGIPNKGIGVYRGTEFGVAPDFQYSGKFDLQNFEFVKAGTQMQRLIARYNISPSLIPN